MDHRVIDPLLTTGEPVPAPAHLRRVLSTTVNSLRRHHRAVLALMPRLPTRLALPLGHLLELLPRPTATLRARQRRIRRRRQRTVTRVTPQPPLKLRHPLGQHAILLAQLCILRPQPRVLRPQLGEERLQPLITESLRIPACRSHACNIPCKAPQSSIVQSCSQDYP